MGSVKYNQYLKVVAVIIYVLGVVSLNPVDSKGYIKEDKDVKNISMNADDIIDEFKKDNLVEFKIVEKTSTEKTRGDKRWRNNYLTVGSSGKVYKIEVNSEIYNKYEVGSKIKMYEDVDTGDYLLYGDDVVVKVVE